MNSLYWNKINFNGNICCTKIILPVFILMTYSTLTILFKAALSSCEIPHSVSSNERWNNSAYATHTLITYLHNCHVC